MKKQSCVMILCLLIKMLNAQSVVDSLKNRLLNAQNDTATVAIYEKLSSFTPGFALPNQEKIDFGLKGYELAKSIRHEKGQVSCGLNAGFLMVEKDYFKALSLLSNIKPICEKNKDTINLVRVNGSMGYAYNKFDSQKALYYYDICLKLMLKAHVSEAVLPIYTVIGYAYKDAGILDSALIFLQKGYQSSLSGISPIRISDYDVHFGEIYYKKGDIDLAMPYFRTVLILAKRFKGQASYGIANIFKDRGQIDSAKFYAKESLKYEQQQDRKVYIIKSAQLLFDLYKNSNPKEALNYLVIASAAKDSLFTQDKARQVEKLEYEEREREAISQRRIKAHELDVENKVKFYTLLGVLVSLGIFTFILYRNNQQKQKANNLLQEQKDKVEITLSQLKATQTQLIQSEKLASLGELTAGIAHEIQNPLNFVNNFSELSVDLVKDLNDEIHKPDIDKTYVEELLTDLTSNQEKINHHGKRAASIVTGMLQHSRASTGKRELTDINKLADEYLRLSYHGLRAKEKDFNADFTTDFDENLPKINIIPQDIGRVLLNLINNAFYAVNEKSKQNTEGGYKPTVLVSTQQLDNQIIIKVKDNGIGMPESVKAKVFQPFFTTKPTGSGTGLGLSLAYDIVTKGHGGTLEVESTEGVGSEFIITLPFKTNG